MNTCTGKLSYRYQVPGTYQVMCEICVVHHQFRLLPTAGKYDMAV